jgi:hypothetical protein
VPIEEEEEEEDDDDDDDDELWCVPSLTPISIRSFRKN